MFGTLRVCMHILNLMIKNTQRMRGTYSGCRTKCDQRATRAYESSIGVRVRALLIIFWSAQRVRKCRPYACDVESDHVLPIHPACIHVYVCMRYSRSIRGCRPYAGDS
jgi:hypothetical protein